MDSVVIIKDCFGPLERTQAGARLDGAVKPCYSCGHINHGQWCLSTWDRDRCDRCGMPTSAQVVDVGFRYPQGKPIR